MWRSSDKGRRDASNIEQEGAEPRNKKKCDEPLTNGAGKTWMRRKVVVVRTESSLISS